MLGLLGAAAILVSAGLAAGAPVRGAAVKDAAGQDVLVGCGDKFGVCIVSVLAPGTSGSRDGAGAGKGESSSGPAAGPPAKCRDSVQNIEVACFDPNRGTWSAADDCYAYEADPQPPKTDPVWKGHTGGVVLVMSCPFASGLGGYVWRPSSAAAGGGGPSMTPAQLAERAVELLPIHGPDIQMAPPADVLGLVGLPVWLWTTVSEVTWGPSSRTASVPGLSVTATARAEKIVWDLGDGERVTCTGPGTPYSPARGDQPSPDCGHMFTRSSAGQPHDKYPVTATTTWRINWSGGGQSGVIYRTRASSTEVAVGELQVLVS